MQSRPCVRLATKLRRLREKTPADSWAVICMRFNILKADGKPDTGMAYRIAHDDYEPRDAEIRKRIGLPAVCLSCHRPLHRQHRTYRLNEHDRWWRGLSKAAKANVFAAATQWEIST